MCTGDTRLQYLDTHMAMIAAYKWRDLGAKLLEKGMLDVIEADHPHDTVGCCKHVFRKWLEITPDASCDQLISALRSPTVQLDYLADQLEERWGIKCKIYGNSVVAIVTFYYEYSDVISQNMDTILLVLL